MREACTLCLEPIRSVDSITLRSLLKSEAQERTQSLDGYHFCSNPRCALVYLNPSDAITYSEEDLIVPFWNTGTTSSRLVCYCFGVAVRDLLEEVANVGQSEIAASILSRCRNHEERCQERNPQGHCCLGNIKRVVFEAKTALGMKASETDTEEKSSCCASEDETVIAQEREDELPC